jgi:hypothetical protein
MHIPCANQLCPAPAAKEKPRIASQYGLCCICRYRLTRNLVPTCGLIPSPALSVIAKELLADLKPTKGDLADAVRMMRGSRHREGLWQDRPVYSTAVVHTRSPRPKLARRMPEFLIGRRLAPTPRAIMSAAIHYHLAIHVLGLGQQPALYLAGASYFCRRALIRPTGQRREYRGKVVNNAYHLRFSEFIAIGRLVLKAAVVLGVNTSHSSWITVRYLDGVKAGQFRKPIVVHPLAGITTGAGDHPLDTFLPHPDLTPSLPRFNSKIRRASGKICGRAEYPEGLDVSLEELSERVRHNAQLHHNQNQIKLSDAPSTNWLFSL